MGSMLHEDHEFGGQAPCLAVLHLATAEDRFSWGGAGTEGQCARLEAG